MHGLTLLIQNNLRDRGELSTRDRGHIPEVSSSRRTHIYMYNIYGTLLGDTSDDPPPLTPPRMVDILRIHPHLAQVYMGQNRPLGH